MEKYFQNTKHWILNTIFFLFPFFFLPFTQEYFTTGKFYFLAFGALLLILISGLEILTTKKFSWQKGTFDNLLFLFLITIGLSIVIVSPNKIQALLNVNFGLVMIASLTILYFYLSRGKNSDLGSKIYHLTSLILSILTIAFFFDPLKNTVLPQSMQFLKTTGFTFVGNQLDLAIYLGFFVVWGAMEIINRTSTKKNVVNTILWVFNLSAFSLVVYQLVRSTTNILPPFRISWYAAVETLKTPLSAFFGVGVDNFVSMFTRVKDLSYNQSLNWQVTSFIVSRSTLLHIFTETGVFGFLAFALIIFTLIKQAFSKDQASSLQLQAAIIYWLIVALLFPPSLVVWFLFFMILYFTSQASNFQSQPSSFDLSSFMPIYLGMVIIILAVVGASSYFLGRSYAAEVYFKKSIDGYTKNSIKELYDNQRQAIIINPYIEKFRINFSQTNLLIANNLASKTTNKLSDQDKQNITQAVQAAISEAKAAVALNSQKASNWENLALIYRNVINVAQGADVWTISAYQRAIVADPQNPTYRLNLGGVYYSLGNYEEASNLFSQSVSLKTNWPNAYYNFAWSSYQNKKYQQAVNAMENALKLIDPIKDKTDYEKAKAELDEFKTKLPKEETQTKQTEKQPSQLALPTPIPTTGQPKIELPKNASPEAK